MARPGSDLARLPAEHRALEALAASEAQGAAHFTRLVPQRVAEGVARLGLRGDEGQRHVGLPLAQRLRARLRRRGGAHPGGVVAEASVWLWKRVLEVLGFIHHSGWVHGDIRAEHLRVHARDHGVTLIGFALARPLASALDGGDGGARAVDIAASALAVSAARPRGAWRGGRAARRRQRRPHRRCLVGRDQLDAAAAKVFGPPKFIPLTMPGWAS
ncbi:MAG: hypothetical protein WKG00_34065 [Polyangiaceae bacterium]